MSAMPGVITLPNIGRGKRAVMIAAKLGVVKCRRRHHLDPVDDLKQKDGEAEEGAAK